MLKALILSLILSAPPIESAHINAPGQLVLVRYVENYGVIEESYTVVLSVREPTLCDMKDDKRYVIYTEDFLVIEKAPTVVRACPDYDFKNNKCKK